MSTSEFSKFHFCEKSEKSGFKSKTVLQSDSRKITSKWAWCHSHIRLVIWYCRILQACDRLFAVLGAVPICYLWKSNGLMDSALDSGSSGPGWSPGRRHYVLLLGTHFTRSAFFHFNARPTLWWNCTPSRGRKRNIPSYFMQQKSE